MSERSLFNDVMGMLAWGFVCILIVIPIIIVDLHRQSTREE